MKYLITLLSLIIMLGTPLKTLGMNNDEAGPSGTQPAPSRHHHEASTAPVVQDNGFSFMGFKLSEANMNAVGKFLQKFPEAAEAVVKAGGEAAKAGLEIQRKMNDPLGVQLEELKKQKEEAENVLRRNLSYSPDLYQNDIASLKDAYDTKEHMEHEFAAGKISYTDYRRCDANFDALLTSVTNRINYTPYNFHYRATFSGFKQEFEAFSRWATAAIQKSERKLADINAEIEQLEHNIHELAIQKAKEQEKTKQTAVTAHEQKEAAIATAQIYAENSLTKFKETLQWVKKNPYLIPAAMSAAALGIYGAKEGTRILGRYIEAKLGKPKIIRESSVDTYLNRLTSSLQAFIKLKLLRQKPGKPTINNVILRPDLKESLMNIAQVIKSAQKNKVPYTNVMFYGPPGVGKTMFAKELARYSDMEYAVFSGTDLMQLETGPAITELNNLIDWAEKSTRGLILFIDEADSFLADRYRSTTSVKAKDILSSFLTRVEKPSSAKIMFVFATNHPELLDKAVLSRIGKTVEFPLPGLEERIKILELYIAKYIRAKKLVVDKQVTDNLRQFAEQLNGFSGRSIEQTVVDMLYDIMAHGTKTLTLDIAQKTVVDAIKQHKQNGAWKQ